MNAIIVISEADNVATALEPLSPGMVLNGAAALTVRDVIPRGHKIALRTIPAGSSVMKYGSPIGVAIAEIPAGAHVHTHNVSSARGRGDLNGREKAPADGRIAEPPDDKGNP